VAKGTRPEGLFTASAAPRAEAHLGVTLRRERSSGLPRGEAWPQHLQSLLYEIEPTESSYPYVIKCKMFYLISFCLRFAAWVKSRRSGRWSISSVG
jgi:hypothetical protein